MAAFTSSQTGNWSASSTWGGAGVPGSGDTVSIGAHTITVDVNTAVGTSPNDITTAVISMTSGSSVLIVATGATLTVKGNIGEVNGSTLTMNAGSSLVFDASASGGTPVYKFINAGFCKLNLNGTVGSHVTMSAVTGQAFSLGQNYSVLAITYSDFTRMAASGLTCNNTNASIANSTFTSCGKLDFTATVGGTNNYTFNNNTFAGTTGSSGSFQNGISAAFTSGSRQMTGNIFDQFVSYNGKNFAITSNYFGGGMTCIAGATWQSVRLNCFHATATNVLNGGSGALMTGSFERNYFVVDNAAGNSHFVAPTALLGADTIVSQNVFEAYAPDLVDTGDCILLNSAAASGGNKVVAKNNIVLRDSYPATSVASGTMLTLFSATSAVLSEFYRNTSNIDNSAVVGKRGSYAIAEGSTGFAGQVSALKSNVVWGSTSGQGYVGERVTGNVKDIITAAGADFNWVFNTSTGDNQRGYEDKAASNTFWTAGDAVAASVDTHQGSGDPQFFDSTRNLASWATARSYGAGDYAAALTALQSDPTRTADLIAYVFQGFRPGNAAMRNAAHDGGCVGAANFYKASRTTGLVTAHRTSLAKFGL